MHAHYNLLLKIPPFFASRPYFGNHTSVAAVAVGAAIAIHAFIAATIISYSTHFIFRNLISGNFVFYTFYLHHQLENFPSQNVCNHIFIC